MPSSSKGDSRKTVIALNGFLGRTSDWDLIENLLPSGWSLHAVDLLNESIMADYDEWAKRFNEGIARDLAGRSPKVLLGYSMGGRLAAHALIKSPDLFDGAVIVSANPGLLSEQERTLRRQFDDIWAAKFMQATEESWPALMIEWNSQATLRPPRAPLPEAIVLERKAADFRRPALAQALRTWSLGVQRNLRPEIASLKLPIEFVTGQDDVKFTSLARDLVNMKAEGPREHVVIPNAGHRVPWDAPTQFRASLAKFLSRW